MSRLLIVSNRLPIRIIKRKSGLVFKRSVGGLATGLASFYEKRNSLWIGWPGISLSKIQSKKQEIRKKLKSEKCLPIFISKKDVDKYYYGFCNKTIWPLFQYFSQHVVYDESYWQAYQKVNQLFCKQIVKITKSDDIIWIHDYHLMVLPQLLREKVPQASIGFFLHIPFPSFEMFRLLPWRKQIISGLLGADLLGFHTYDYVRHFLNSTHSLLGFEHTLGEIIVNNHIAKADIFPMGINFKKFARSGKRKSVLKKIEEISKKVGKRKVVLSIDRLDYTKGILKRLEAIEQFLKKYPQFKEKVTFILVAVPSRTKVDQYQELKKQVDELIGRINGKYANIGWVPIWYLYKSLGFNTLTAFYQAADVALITPLRDGMNLIAKEYIASKTEGDGILILSEMAGSAKELGETIIVNPNNKQEVADAIKEALLIPEEEKKERNKIMQKRLKQYNINRWAKDFINSLLTVKKKQKNLSSRRLTEKIKKKLIKDYKASKKRLILLDYDGTLIPFTGIPEKAVPNEQILSILKELLRNKKNEVVIISGRDKNILQKWFGKLGISLIAEHGTLIKDKNRRWQLVEHQEDSWKEQIRPILNLYVDRTPGSLIEEKDFTLAWHYRKADYKLASIRVKELKEDLRHLTANLNFGFLEGNKVVEIKRAGINKGRATQYWLDKNKWDFILAIGDDVTDEDTFLALPKSAYTIKVGFGPSEARFNLRTVNEVRSLLGKLA